MTKIIKIENCICCAYNTSRCCDTDFMCTVFKRTLNDDDMYMDVPENNIIKDFPDWCPLEDEKITRVCNIENPKIYVRCIKDYLIRKDLIFKVGETYGCDYRLNNKGEQFYVKDVNDENFKFYKSDFNEHFEFV